LPKLNEQAAFWMLFVGRLWDEAQVPGAPVGYLLQHAVWHHERESARAQHSWTEIPDSTTHWLWEAAMAPLYI